jgi:hypothetical protein
LNFFQTMRRAIAEFTDPGFRSVRELRMILVLPATSGPFERGQLFAASKFSFEHFYYEVGPSLMAAWSAHALSAPTMGQSGGFSASDPPRCIESWF